MRTRANLNLQVGTVQDLDVSSATVFCPGTHELDATIA